MASTRDVIAPPVFAESASTVIPPTPIAGVAYRDPVAGPASSAGGWPYQEIVNSAEWNQLVYQWSKLLSIIDLKGILGWSSIKDYTENSVVFGSDGTLYLWLQESGPGTGAGIQDPVSAPLYWSAGVVEFASIAQAVAGSPANLAIDPPSLHAARMRRITRITSATLQTISDAATGPATYAPLSYSFVADGGMYDIFVKINLNLDSTNSTASQYIAAKLLNGATVLDTSAHNLQVNQFYGVQLVLKWSGVLSGNVDLTVTFEKTTTAVGTSLTVNGDRDNTTNNDSGQLSCIEVFRMGA